MMHQDPTLPRQPATPGALRSALFTAVATALVSSGALAAPIGYPPASSHTITFSVDAQGPTVTTLRPDGFYGIGILGTDILTPALPGPPGPNPPSMGPLPAPGEFIVNPPFPPVPGLNINSASVELDAMSFGRDPMDVPFPNQLPNPLYYVFSVDEFAIGLAGTDVRAEGALGAQEASADTFIILKPTPLPASPFATGTNYAFTDGNGLAPSGTPGVGLIEPNAPTVRAVPDPGDNLDALDIDTTLADRSGPLYFSLDSAFADPLEAAVAPPNYGTAALNGFVGGDVLVGVPAVGAGGAISRYAAAPQLGLDQFGQDTDDLDALKLWENGTSGYQVSVVPFDWMTGMTDMLLFSVRRGSEVIHERDSIYGEFIEEGDVLTTPCPVGTALPDMTTVCFGGPNPGIFTAAERLGLATVRSGTGKSWGIGNAQWGGQDLWADDLDALDQVVPVPAPLALMLAGLGALAAVRRRRGSAV